MRICKESVTMSTVITSIDPHSPAEKAGIVVGEQLLEINGHHIVDVLDYRFYGYDPVAVLRLSKDGHTRTVTIRKEEGRDLGLNFNTYLMDEMHQCANHCLFCFVDQMPPNMRPSLYIKDDDERLSFLLGNYTTLTNLSEREAQRIIDLHISPINVSVHATEPQLHCTLLGNKGAERSLEYIRRFCKAGIVMNGQIVVCPGWNDGDALRRTLRDLTDWQFSSCSLVPVGITKYRKGLAKLRPVDSECAREIIAIAEEYGQENLRRRRAVPAGGIAAAGGGVLRGLPPNRKRRGHAAVAGAGVPVRHEAGRAGRRAQPLHHCHRRGRRALYADAGGCRQSVLPQA